MPSVTRPSGCGGRQRDGLACQGRQKAALAHGARTNGRTFAADVLDAAVDGQRDAFHEVLGLKLLQGPAEHGRRLGRPYQLAQVDALHGCAPAASARRGRGPAGMLRPNTATDDARTARFLPVAHCPPQLSPTPPLLVRAGRRRRPWRVPPLAGRNDAVRFSAVFHVDDAHRRQQNAGGGPTGQRRVYGASVRVVRRVQPAGRRTGRQAAGGQAGGGRAGGQAAGRVLVRVLRPRPLLRPR